eukprot:4601062-Alexandrium_andersonii.AAC.1
MTVVAEGAPRQTFGINAHHTLTKHLPRWFTSNQQGWDPCTLQQLQREAPHLGTPLADGFRNGDGGE